MNETRIKETLGEKVALAVTAIFSVLLRGVVLVSIVSLLLLLSSPVLVRPAFAQSSPAAVQIEGGIAKEEVDGDLKSAMEVYQKIAADSSAARDVRAKALLRLAGCYEKLGRQAKQVYEQIVRDYADQPAATQARTRLASLNRWEHPAAPTTMTVRKIEWPAVGHMGPSDTDGQRAVYRSPDGNLYFGDLAVHTKRLVFKAQPSETLGWIASRDFSKVALQFPNPDQSERWAVVNMDGTGYRELARLNHRSTGCYNWSWDNRYILRCDRTQSGTSRLLALSAANGQVRELVSTDAETIGKAAFSPDGHYVAYDIEPSGNEMGAIRVLIVPAKGGQPWLVYESARRLRMPPGLLDWTADGHNLAIVGVSHQEKTALFLLPIKDGAAAGAPVFVRYGNFEDGYTTLTGAFVYQDHAGAANGGNECFIASIERNWNLGKWRPLDLESGSTPSWNPWPSFSPDGNQVAYVTSDNAAGGGRLILRDIPTGEERVLYRSSGRVHCQYARQTPTVFCSEIESDGKTELFAVATDSGRVEHLGASSGSDWVLQTSYDDRTLYLWNAEGQTSQLVSWDVTTRQETKLEDGFAVVVPAEPPLLARNSDQSLMVRPIPKGDWKPLVRLNKDSIDYVGSRDGKWLLYRDVDATGRQGLFRVSLTGGQPQRVGDYPGAGGGGLRISPDGGEIIAVVFNWEKYDLWVLDNFIPSAQQSGGAR